MPKEVEMMIDIIDGDKVFVGFKTPVEFLEMTPLQAVNMAKALFEKAQQIAKKSNSPIVIPGLH